MKNQKETLKVAPARRVDPSKFSDFGENFTCDLIGISEAADIAIKNLIFLHQSGSLIEQNTPISHELYNAILNLYCLRDYINERLE